MSKTYFLQKIFFVVTIALLSNTAYSFVKFYLLTNDEGNTILILGDYHFEDSLMEKNKEHVDRFIEKALESNSNNRIPCIVELDNRFELAFKGETLPEGHKMADTMAHLSTYVSKGIAGKKVKFITYDPRDLDCVLLTETMKWLAQFVSDARANRLLISQDMWDVKVKPNFLHTSEGKNYTVKSYFTQLDEKILYIKSLTEKYASHSSYAKLFIELYDKFVQAKDEAKKYFAESSFDRPMILAVLDMFDNHLESAKFLHKYEEFKTILLSSLDYLYFDICCLDKMLSLCPQISNKLALMVGMAHASGICDQLKKIGYKSILEEVNAAYMDGTLVCIASADLVNLELAFFLFFSDASIPAEVLPNLERATNVAAASFKQRVANTIKKHSSLGLTPTPIKQYEPSDTLTSDFKLLTVQNSPTSIASILDSRCHNNECQKKANNTCTRCKKARYCSKECQLTDWQTRHKLQCKSIQN